MSSERTGEKPDLPVIAEGREISRNEIMDVLADQGYSANARKEWLKCVLTRLSAQEGRSPPLPSSHPRRADRRGRENSAGRHAKGGGRPDAPGQDALAAHLVQRARYGKAVQNG